VFPAAVTYFAQKASQVANQKQKALLEGKGAGYF
jgi:hypothetical protein